MRVRRPCRHCGNRPANRNRGLCWKCCAEPAVSGQYPTESKFGRRSRPDRLGHALSPLAPTAALPGTAAKVAVLTERASRG
jgi:hypothetical protein